VREPARHRRVLGRVLLWLALGGWLGALLLCGAVVVRVAFEVVPDSEIAGHLVGRVLRPLQLTGIGLGLLLTALGGWLRRGWPAVLLPLALAGLCAANQLWVAPAVAAIDLTDPATGADAAARFARFHKLSVWLYLATSLGAVALAVLHGVAEVREERPAPPESAKNTKFP